VLVNSSSEEEMLLSLEFSSSSDSSVSSSGVRGVPGIIFFLIGLGVYE